MKRMLITGASGFLGKRVASYYKSNYIIFTPTHAEMDITDPKSVENLFSKLYPDIVVHCAAISDTGTCEREPERSRLINLDGSVNVARATGIVGAKCVLCSSDQVYFTRIAPMGLYGHKESEVLNPGNEYGRQKQEAERRCLEINPDCVMLRLSWMYDTETKSASEHGDFMRTLLAKLDSGEELSYAVHDIRGISDVNEVIQNLEKTFTLAGGVYNFGSPNDKNMYETMRAVFSNRGWNADKILKNEAAFHDNPRNISMCQEKINNSGIFFTDTTEQIVRVLRGKCLTKCL